MTKGLEVCGSASIGVWGSAESWGHDSLEVSEQCKWLTHLSYACLAVSGQFNGLTHLPYACHQEKPVMP